MLEKIKEWLFKPAKSKEQKVSLALSAFAICVLWVFSIVGFLNLISDFPVIATFFFACIFAPLWEELAFRVAPIWIARLFGEKFIIPVVIISSLLFGWGHGNGPVSLLIQGAMGFVFSALYLKTNYWYAVALHSAWNTFVIFGL